MASTFFGSTRCIMCLNFAIGVPASGFFDCSQEVMIFAEQFAGFGGESGEDRGEVDGELAEQVERDGADVLKFFCIFGIFAQFPGGIGLDVGIGAVGDLDDEPHGVCEVAGLVGGGDLVACGGGGLEEPAVVRVALARGRRRR